MARMTMKGAYDNGANDAFPGPANDRSPGPRNSERQITAAAVTQGAVDFVYGASLRVFLIPNEGAITKVSGDFKDNFALNTKWMLSPFALILAGAPRSVASIWHQCSIQHHFYLLQ